MKPAHAAGSIPKFGVGGINDVPVELLQRRARAAEELGFDHFWLADERLCRNPYVGLAAAAMATKAIQLGLSVTNPYTRHPAHTAAAIATVDELSGGRTTLGLGPGGDMSHYGLAKTRPSQAIRETVQIVRELTSGSQLSYRGELFSTNYAHLGFAPPRQTPIYIAGRGPRILSLAGEIGDGVILGGFASESGLRYALDRVSTGIARAQRSWESLDVVAWLYLSVSANADLARRAVRRIVMASIVTSRPVLGEIGINLPPRLQRYLDERQWVLSPEELVAGAAYLEDEHLAAFAVFGSADDCIEKLAAIGKPPVKQMAFVLFPPEDSDRDNLLDQVGGHVLPELRTELTKLQGGRAI
jgi:5,10-methylenetetrahydromethanopterin reductase